MDMQPDINRVDYEHGLDALASFSPFERGGPFRGGKYSDIKSFTKNKGGYSMSRTAGQAISILAMAASGLYTFEQLMDPEQNIPEKREMYDRVVTTMENVTGDHGDPNQEWIAEQIYNGRNAAFRMMNEQAGQVDYSDPNILSNKRFCMLQHLSHALFDCWQEASHCQDEIVSLAQKDDPNIINYEKFKEAWSDIEPPFEGIAENITMLRDFLPRVSSGEVSKSNSVDYEFSVIAGSVFYLDHKLKFLQEMASKDPIPDIRHWQTREEKMADVIERSLINERIKNKVTYLSDQPLLAASLVPKVLSGELTKGVTFDGESMEVKGWPSQKDVLGGYPYIKEANDLDAALGEFDTKRTDWWFSKESPVHKAVRESAQSLKEDIDALKYGVHRDGPQKGKPLSGEERQALLESIEKKSHQVEKDADKYLSERKGTRGTEAGNKRKAGAQKIKDFAASIREKIAPELAGYRIQDQIKSMESSKSRDRIYSNFQAVIDLEYVEPEGFKKEFTKGMARKIADIEVNKGHMTAEQAKAGMGKFIAGLQKDKTYNNWVDELSVNSDKRMALRGLSTGEIYSKFVELKTKENKMSSEARENAPHRQAQVQKEAKAPQAPGM
ncbi:MAG: hypothetical protein K6F00_04430 [Lachnospiraceae bacterium]|nr:hypothetical protein [Lachnospiraceae bacterium]